jgi:crotonobetainyl-CoA:carnitine CoA-transferase CaiB-like acyl-CoA transferase
MGQGEKAMEPAFIDMNARRNNIAAVDALIETWTREHPVAELAPLLKKNGIPAGAIASGARASACQLPFKLTASGKPIARSPRAEMAGVSAKVLDGVRVIEIGPFTAGPVVGRSLSDLGADVVKIEPEKGEVSRSWSPRAGHVSGYFANYNTGKKSLMLDLARGADRATFETLLAGADVLVQNLKAGALDKLGFGVEAVTARHPQLIYCSISGYGQDGAPDAALDTVIQAESGIMAKVGDGATPCKVGFSVADLIAGHLSVLGILAALRKRDRDGIGQQVDVSMLAALEWLMVQGCDYPANAFDGTAMRNDREKWVLRRAGQSDVPVRDLGDVFADASLQTRGMLRRVSSSAGMSAWIMGSPYQLALTPPVPGAMIGEPGADRDGVMRAWALPPVVHGEVA